MPITVQNMWAHNCNLDKMIYGHLAGLKSTIVDSAQQTKHSVPFLCERVRLPWNEAEWTLIEQNFNLCPHFSKWQFSRLTVHIEKSHKVIAACIVMSVTDIQVTMAKKQWVTFFLINPLWLHCTFSCSTCVTYLYSNDMDSCIRQVFACSTCKLSVQ